MVHYPAIISSMSAKVLIRGGGDLASGVAARLYRAGLKVLITELAQPLVIRRSVSFAEAVFTGETKVEEITARLGTSYVEVIDILDNGEIAVLSHKTFYNRIGFVFPFLSLIFTLFFFIKNIILYKEIKSGKKKTPKKRRRRKKNNLIPVITRSWFSILKIKKYILSFSCHILIMIMLLTASLALIDNEKRCDTMR